MVALALLPTLGLTRTFFLRPGEPLTSRDQARAAALFSHYSDAAPSVPNSDSADSPQHHGVAALGFNPVQVREAARTLRGVFGEFHSDHDAVLRVLHQHPELVRAICTLYDSEFSRTGQGFAADLKRFLDEPYIGVAEALLARAGVSTGRQAVTYVKQSTKEHSQSRHAIVASPAVKVAVPGTEVSYSVVKDAEIYSEGSYYAYQWLCLNDPQTSRIRGKPAVAWGPTGTSQWSARWDFPGNHKVLCRVQFREKNPGLLSGYTSYTPEYIEYQQTVQEQGDVLARELDKSPQREAPDEQLHQLQAYHQALRTAEEQRGSNKLDPQTQEALDHQIAKLREKLKSTEGRTRYPLKAVHIAAENAQISQLNVFLARTAAGDGQETWTLVDITNPTDRRLTGEYCGTGKDAQHSVEQAVAEWERGNRYPKGRLRVKVPSAAGAELDQEFQTDGMSFWDSVGEFFSQVGFWAGMGMVGAAVLTTIAPDPAVSKAAAALLWASILAGSAGASINMIQRHAEGMSTLTEDAFDALTIAGNILGARWALGATVTGLSLAGSRMGTGLVIGRIGTDAAQGILLSAEYIREYQEVLADPEPKRRTDKLVQLLGKAALSGGLLILSMRGSKADLEQLGAQNMKLGKLGHPGETIDLGETQTEGAVSSAPTVDKHAAAPSQVAQAQHETEAPSQQPKTTAGQKKGRVTEPVPGLYDSIDATRNTAPPGWSFHDEITPRRDIPGAVQYKTEVVGPEGKTGWIQRVYDPKNRMLIMENAFLDQLPKRIEAGIPLEQGKGTPTVTYLTLRQMRMADIHFADLKSVKMSTIQNLEAVMQLKQLTDQGLSLDEAVRQTHSVQYAATSIQQSGHAIAGVRLVVTSNTWEEPLDMMMTHYETRGRRYPPDPEKVKKHEELLAKYNMKRTDIVLANYDIYIDLIPHPNNPK